MNARGGATDGGGKGARGVATDGGPDARDADGGGERAAFERCIRDGGIAVFPADTVYGLACDPADAEAVRRLYALKGRDDGKPAALMFFDRDAALVTVAPGRRTRALAEALLPGGVTLLVPAYADATASGVAAGTDAAAARWPRAVSGGLLGVRVPAGGPLAGADVVVLQSSANLAGEPAATRIDEVPRTILDGADVVIDAGPLPGTPSTVIDLGAYETDGTSTIVRAGALSAEDIAAAEARLRDR